MSRSTFKVLCEFVEDYFSDESFGNSSDSDSDPDYLLAIATQRLVIADMRQLALRKKVRKKLTRRSINKWDLFDKEYNTKRRLVVGIHLDRSLNCIEGNMQIGCVSYGFRKYFSYTRRKNRENQG